MWHTNMIICNTWDNKSKKFSYYAAVLNTETNNQDY